MQLRAAREYKLDSIGPSRAKNCKFYYGGWDENGTRLHWANGSITLNITTALTGFRFFSSNGTAFENEGKMLIYGLKES